MLDISLIVSVIPERFPLLQRSLETWQDSIKESGLKCRIDIWSNGCDLNTLLDAMPYNFNYDVQLSGSIHRSGSHIEGYNRCYQNVRAKTYLFTHPEILFPRDTIATAFENAQDNVFVAFKCFWLGERTTQDIEMLNWRKPETIENLPMLYDDDPRTHGSMYNNDQVRGVTCWESTTTFAYNAMTARKIFPFPDLGHQGYDDPAHAGFRQRLGIRNHTVMDPILYHQWHPATWDGDAGLAVREATVEINKRFSQ